MSEKGISLNGLPAPLGSNDGLRLRETVSGVITHTWSASEERRLLFKVDCLVLEILTPCFFFFQLDRTNIGNALTDNFLVDVGITQDWFNVGQQLLNAGIVLHLSYHTVWTVPNLHCFGQIPSNILLYRIGPKLWISIQIALWGLVATFQASQHGLGVFLATRLLLGLLESGFIPGSLYTISLWYKKSELSRRFGIFFLGNGIAQACGGLMAYGILHMRGVGNLAGWQWMFILEGISTLISAVVFIVFFPGDPENPVSMLKVCYFEEREITILRHRLFLDGTITETPSKRRITIYHVLETIRDPKLWPHVIITIAGLAPTTALWNYAPTIIASFGYGKLAANAMTSVGSWISVFLVVVAAVVADKTGRRGFVVLFGVICEFTFMVTFKSLPDTSDGRLKFAILTMSVATCSWWHSVNGSWLSINAKNPEERAIRMAIFIMAANCAGIVGGQLFRSDDLPYYHRGWSIITALISISLAMIMTLLFMYCQANKKVQKSEESTSSLDGETLRQARYNFWMDSSCSLV